MDRKRYIGQPIGDLLPDRLAFKFTQTFVRRAKQGASYGESNPIIENQTSTIYRVLRGC
jgi:hypothetical protein